MPKTLSEVMPREFSGYSDIPAFKHKDVFVKAEHFGDRRWPGTQKNVHFWVELENGKSVGWNENPATGWSFPVIKSK